MATLIYLQMYIGVVELNNIQSVVLLFQNSILISIYVNTNVLILLFLLMVFINIFDLYAAV